MTRSFFFHVAFVVLFCLYAVVRGYFKMKTGTVWKTAFSRREGLLSQAVRVVLIPPLYAGVFLSCFAPRRFSFLYLELHPALRVLGLSAGLFSLASLGWVHSVLNDNFTASVEVRRGARLVTNGPYGIVRHPMYALYAVFFLGAFLLSGNWVVGISAGGICADLMFLRLPFEERELERRFGERYREYCRGTRRFIPGIY